MEKYPLLEMNLSKFYGNAKIVTKLCKESNVNVAGIIKGFGGIYECAVEMVKGGCAQIGSSRIEQLRELKEKGINVPLMLVRIPMKCEIEDVIRYSDICLVSEKVTLKYLNDEAKKLNKKYKVILMYDLGDLREGVISKEELLELSIYTEYQLEYIELEGIGTSLSCYGSVAPTKENLNELCIAAELIENNINRSLNIVSGGSTTTLPLVVNGVLPKKINHLRLGESISNTQDLPMHWECCIEGLDPNTFILKSQIIELNYKPTYPIGILKFDSFGEAGNYVDNGIRKRAIIALGNQDVGDCFKLIPLDKEMKILGASSDHTILDIHDCKNDYKLGDVVGFHVLYEPMLFSSLSGYVHKKFVR